MNADGADFGLQAHLDHLHATRPPRLALRADTMAELRSWQQTLRGEVLRLLGLSGRPARQQLARDGNYAQALTLWYQTDLRSTAGEDSGANGPPGRKRFPLTGMTRPAPGSKPSCPLTRAAR